MNKKEWSFLPNPNVQRNVFIKILKRLVLKGSFAYPRKLKIIELENFNYSLPPYIRFMNFSGRKFKLDYTKREFLWYLRGDRFDVSITEYAKLWNSTIDKDGSINSNYGQYIFGKINQFDNVVKTLKEDKDSRRASIMILSRDHLLSETNDYPCTYSLNFRIRNNVLNMTVRMRSQDAIYGMGNDAPAFSFIHEMLTCSLRKYYPALKYGEYYHSADSFHIYERHFEIAEKLTGLSIVSDSRKIQKDNSYSLILCPKISSWEEVDFLRKNEFSDIPKEFKFTMWLNTFEKE